MLRKLIWVLIVLIVAWVWSSTVLNSCSSGITKDKVSSIGQIEKPLFEIDEDNDDDEYIVADGSDGLDEEDIIKNRKEDLGAAKDKLLEKGASVSKEIKKKGSSIKDKIVDKVENSVDKVEKSVDKVKELPKKASKKEIPVSTASSSKGDYLVVAGSFSNEIYADEFVKRLKGMGYGNTEKIVFDFSKYFSVIAGRYKSEKQAEAKELELKKKGIEAYTHQVRSKLFE